MFDIKKGKEDIIEEEKKVAEKAIQTGMMQFLCRRKLCLFYLAESIEISRFI